MCESEEIMIEIYEQKALNTVTPLTISRVHAYI